MYYKSIEISTNLIHKKSIIQNQNLFSLILKVNHLHSFTSKTHSTTSNSRPKKTLRISRSAIFCARVACHKHTSNTVPTSLQIVSTNAPGLGVRTTCYLNRSDSLCITGARSRATHFARSPSINYEPPSRLNFFPRDECTNANWNQRLINCSIKAARSLTIDSLRFSFA